MAESINNCGCESYQPLELSRDQISKRIKASKEILRTLELKEKLENGTALFQCGLCRQFWQKSTAWNWGGATYFFKVPEIEINDWVSEQFVSPAEMLIYNASMTDYYKRTKLIASNEVCEKEHCNGKAIVGNVLCEKHFIESLQKVGLLPKPPSGKVFEPYS